MLSDIVLASKSWMNWEPPSQISLTQRLCFYNLSEITSLPL